MIKDKFSEVNWSPTQQDLSHFAKTLLIGSPLVAIAWFFLIRLFSGSWNFITPLYILSIFIIISSAIVIAPKIFKPLYVIWFFIVCSIDIILSTVLLAITYYAVLFPIGIIYKLIGKSNQFKKDINKNTDSYWNEIPSTKDLKRYYKQF